MNKDFLFACRVCHSPLVASPSDRGATVECPNCSATQSIPNDPAFGTHPSKYLSDVELLGVSTSPASQRPFRLRRVRLVRNAEGEVVRHQVSALLQSLPQGSAIPEKLEDLREERDNLRDQLSDRDRQLAEWQTCHDSVERALKRADQLAAALQSKINATSNELAQARVELAKAKSEAEANRKANEALNRQLQSILKANQSKPPTVAAPVKPAAKRKPGHKTPGELAA